MSTLDAAKNFIKENLIHIISVCVYDARWKNYCVRIEMSRRIAAIDLLEQYELTFSYETTQFFNLCNSTRTISFLLPRYTV